MYEDERWSFAEVMAQVDALAALLAGRFGVRRGDRVAIAMRNYPEWIFAFAAITSIGAIAVCLNAWWTADELAYGLEDSGSQRARSPTSSARSARRRPRRAWVSPCWPCARRRAAAAGRRAPGGSLRQPGADAAGGRRSRPDDDATILYTSGTTGRPKGAVSTQRAVLSALMAFACRAVVARLMAPPAEPHPFPTAFILTVPLFHVTGLVPVMLSCFAGGTKLVMMHKWIAGAGAGADRARAGHAFRRRADHDLGPARVARVREARHLEPAERGRRRRAGAARAGHARRQELPRAGARTSATA